MSHVSVPQDLWLDPMAALLFLKCADCKRYQRSPYLTKSNVVELKPSEVFVDVEETKSLLNISDEVFQKKIDLLKAMKLISTRAVGENIVFQYLATYLPKSPKTNSDDISEGDLEIIPITVEDFSEKYLDYRHQNNKIKTVENDKRVIDLFIKKYGRYQMHKIKPNVLFEFREWRKTVNPNLSKNTLNIDGKTIKVMFNYALRYGHIATSPFKEIKLPSVPFENTKSIEEDSVREIIRLCEDQSLKNVIKFALYTGCRRGEILGLQWKQIDIEERMLNICKNDYFSPKQDRERIIPISCETRDLLKTLERDSSFVFLNNKGLPFKPDNVTKEFKKLVRIVGEDDKIKFHSLRATCISNLVAKGVSLMTIKELMGHATVRTTERYNTTPSKLLYESVDIGTWNIEN
jgi:integrase